MGLFLDICGRTRVELLLMFVFIVNAAADCPTPPKMINILLTDEALLMNRFPEGVTVPLECLNGFIRESGSSIITCIDGNWTEPDLICKRKDCGPPTSQPNMSFNISAGTLFADTIRVFCDEGYRIIGSSYKKCYAFGWFGRAKCEMVRCDAPAKVANGKSSWDSDDDLKYGDIVEYSCNEGYALVGKSSIVCSQTGAYDSQPPECQSVTTEDRHTTNMVTPTSTPPAQEVSTSAHSSATPTAHRDKTITANATPTVSPSAPGSGGILSAKDKATTVSITPTTPFQDRHDEAVDTQRDTEYVPVIISVIGVTVAVCVVLFFLHKFLLRRKGSYDTREDLKPGLLQVQNL